MKNEVKGLTELMSKVNDELKKMEEEREEIIKRSRDFIVKLRKSFDLIYRENFEEAKRNLEKIHDERTSYRKEKKGIEAIFLTYFHPVYMELTEAMGLLFLLSEHKLIDPYFLEIPIVSYLHGLADLIGELKRFSINYILRDKIIKSIETFSLMEAVFNSLSVFTLFPSSLTHNFKRKVDVARRNLEETRTLIASAHLKLDLKKGMKGVGTC